MQFIKLKDVLKQTGLSRTHLYHLMSVNRFPAQIKISHKVVVWLNQDIEQWMQERIEEHRTITM